MNRFAILLLFTLLPLSCLFAQSRPDYAPDQLVIKIKSELAPSFPFPVGEILLGIPVLDDLNRQHELKELRCMGKGKPKNPAIPRPADRTYILTFEHPVNAPELAESYLSTQTLDFAEPNFIGQGGGVNVTNLVPNDANWSRQWGFENDGTFFFGAPVVDADVDMTAAWDFSTGNSNVVTAILDTGNKLDHPEYQGGRIWENAGETGGNGVDDDSNGFADDVNGWDFANGDNDPTDDHGHGTNVTGIIGATGNNSWGYAGVDWNCKLMSCKILDGSNYGFYSWWTDAFYYATDNGASVVNISAGGSSFSNLMQDAVDYAYANEVAIVACMMNTDVSTPYYPAAYTHTIAVGSTSPDDHRTSPFPWSPSSGSNYGNHIDVVAPGNYIYGLHYQLNNNYNTYWSGTSQAAPLVTGLCALLRGIDPSFTVNELRSILQNTAEDQVGNPSEDIAGFDIYYGHGRVNANAALNLALSRPEPLPDLPGISLYPNPVQDQVWLSFEDPTVRWCELKLRDMQGKVLKETKLLVDNGQKSESWELGTLPNGLYLLDVHTVATSGTARLVIVH